MSPAKPLSHRATTGHRLPLCSFTLIELVVVIAVVGILVGLALPAR